MTRHVSILTALVLLPLVFEPAFAAAQAAPKQGSWHVEMESRAESGDKGKINYRLTAAQGLVQPDTKPALTVSEETLTYPSSAGGGAKVTVIRFLSSEVLFREPDLTCDSVTIRLLSPADTQGIAVKPALHFRRDFLGAGFSFQVKIPRGFHYVAGSARSSRTSGLLPTKAPRPFVRPVQYTSTAEAASPHLLSVLLPAPEPRALGAGFEAPYAIEFATAPD